MQRLNAASERRRAMRTLKRSMKKLPLLGLVAVLGAGVGSPGLADAPGRAPGEGVGDYRAKMEKWVETRRILSEERSDWQAEQESLRATRDLLTQEKKALQEDVQELEASNSQSDDERRDLLLQRGDFQRSAQALEQKIRGMEEETLAIVPQLPEPLQKKLQPLIVQIPDDPDKTDVQLGQRLMNVLGLLAQTEKWNGTATFVGETRAVDGSQKVQVRTLYWGLGQAIYVDAQGRTAGVGHPGPSGWEFTNDPDIADAAQRLIDIYQGNSDAIEFVSLPVTIDTAAKDRPR